jgi:outer membrane protein assembly factor BamB
VSIYNTKGEEILSLARESPSSISLGFGHIIIEDRHGIYCYNHSSVEAVWELKLPGNIMFLGFLGNHNRVLSVSPSTARIMERR